MTWAQTKTAIYLNAINVFPLTRGTLVATNRTGSCALRNHDNLTRLNLESKNMFFRRCAAMGLQGWVSGHSILGRKKKLVDMKTRYHIDTCSGVRQRNCEPRLNPARGPLTWLISSAAHIIMRPLQGGLGGSYFIVFQLTFGRRFQRFSKAFEMH